MKKVKITSEKALRNDFHTEESCVNFLIDLKWGGKPKCPKCYNNKRMYFIKSRCTFKCSSCNSSLSVKSGTIFQNSKLSLVDWFQIIYKMATKKCGKSFCSIKLAEDLELTQVNAWKLLNKIRYAMGLENNQKLHGIIEADEVYCGAQLAKDNKLRYKVFSAENERIKFGLETATERKSRLKREKKWEDKTNKKFDSPESKLKEMINEADSIECKNQLISLDAREAKYPKYHYRKNTIGFLERDECDLELNSKGKPVRVIKKYGRLVLRVMGRQQNDMNTEKMHLLLEQVITKGSILITDETSLYNSAKTIVKKHFKIKHTKTRNSGHKPIKYSIDLPPEEDIYYIGYKSTNGIENVNKHIKTMERNYIHLSYKYFNFYLNEFVFAYNTRGLDTHERFERLLRHCLSVSAQYDDQDFLKELNKYSHRPTRNVGENKDYEN